MSKLMELVDDYFDAGVREGAEGRSHDDRGGTAQRLLSKIRAAVAELERDAARWRFIEKNCHAEYHPATCDYWRIASEFKSIDGELEGLAQAIDAAMEAAK